jgi:DNA-binding MarR family transcriptional regulator
MQRRVKYTIASCFLVVSLAFFIFPLAEAESPYVSGRVYIPLDDNVVLEMDKLAIAGSNNLTVTPESHLAIRYTKNNIAIIPPEGSTIKRVSNTSLDLQLENRTTSIYYSEPVKIFTKVNFQSSITDSDEFNLQVYYNSTVPRSPLDENLTSYKIYWGDGMITNGSGVPPDSLSYTYAEQGTYPIIVEFTDSQGITYAYLCNHTFRLSFQQFVGFWVRDNKDPLAAGSAGSLCLFAVMGVAFTESGRYKFLALLTLLLPMSLYIQKEDVLDQFVRGKIFGFIKGNPGVHYNQIMRELDMKNGTLSYHLYMLEKTGMIKSRREGVRYRAFYPTDMKFPEHERYRLTELQLNIVGALKDNPGVSQKFIARLLNEKHQTISYNIKVLQQSGLVTLSRKGRKTLCYPTEDPSFIGQ